MIASDRARSASPLRPLSIFSVPPRPPDCRHRV